MFKIISYLGFAQKSNNCIMGQTALKKCKKQLHLILVDSSASENLINLAKNVAKKHACECVVTKMELKNLIKFQDIKIIALTDENLSKAIIKRFQEISC